MCVCVTDPEFGHWKFTQRLTDAPPQRAPRKVVGQDLKGALRRDTSHGSRKRKGPNEPMGVES